MSLSLSDTKAILRAVNRATEELGFCRNRVWAIAKSLPGGPEKFPELLPALNIPLPETKREDHQLCTFDFCEQSRVNFTLVTQRHEPPCKGDRCCTVNFPSEIVEEAVSDGQPVTAWNIEWDRGEKEILRHNERYMAISHVWSDGTGAGSQARGDVNACLVDFFRGFARDFECKGIWWDTICIPTKKDLREKALKRMHLNYKSAAVTLIHDCFLRECEWRDAELACFQIVMSPWFSRGWTALELKMSQRVQIIFKGPKGPITKDLDRDILQAAGDTAQIASGMLERLRMGRIDRLDLLLAVLGSRHTSWPRDMAIISGLMIEIELPEDYAHQRIYQEILQTLGKISQAHLFHNSGTMTGGYNWCPTDIYDLPTTLSSRTLEIERNGNLLGEWNILSLDNISDDRFALGHAHPLIEGKVRLALEEKDHHILLLEDQSSTIREIGRALLVRPEVRHTESHLDCYCDYVGPVYFHPPLTELEFISFDCPAFTIHVGQDEVHRGESQSSESRQTVKCIIEDMKNHSSLSPRFRKREDDPVKLDLTSWNGSKLWQEFMKAATDGDYETTKRLLEVVPDPTGTDPTGLDQSRSTALHVATWNGHSEVVKLILAKLLAQGLTPQQKNSRGEEPLHLASERGNEELVCTLLPYSTPDLRQEDGLNALHLAAKHGFTGIVNTILRQNWDINALSSTSQTALHVASYWGHDDVVDVLIDQKADQRLGDGKGKIAYSLAVLQGHKGTAKLLRNDRSNPDFDEKEFFLLHETIIANNNAAIRILAELGANLEALDDDYRTPLHYAAVNDRATAIKILAEFGANLEARDSDNLTPLHFAALNGAEDAIKMLVEFGANLDARDIVGRTPLHISPMNGAVGSVKVLSELGTNIEAQDNRGRTPLHHAVIHDSVRVINMLAETEANLEAQDIDGRTPLHYSAIHDRVGVMKILAGLGANLEAQDKNGRAPLHHAASNDAVSAIKVLAELGANLDAQDNDGKTPLHVAPINDSVRSIKVLSELGANLEAQDNLGSTPLHHAALVNALGSIKILGAELGVNLEARDNDGWTALRKAELRGPNDTSNILSELIKGRQEI